MSESEVHKQFTYNSCGDSTLKCNYIKPFNDSVYNRINNLTNKKYSENEIEIINKTFGSICSSKGGNKDMCCSKNFKSQNQITTNYINKFNEKYIKHKINYKDRPNNLIENIELLKAGVDSESDDDKYSFQNGWDSSPIDGYLICKIGTSVEPTDDPNVLVAKNLIQDCFSNNCDNTERMTIENIMNLSTNNEKFIYMDDLKAFESVKNRNIEFIKSYLRKKNDTDIPLTHDDKNNRLIHLAALHNNIDIVQLLIQLDADLNLQNYQGNTPLHIAITNSNFRMVELLLKAGSEINMKDYKGNNSAFKAIETNNINMLVYIYNKGGNLYEKNNKGDDIIQYTIQNSSNKYLIVSYLAEKGVPLNENNKTYYLVQNELTKIRKENNNKMNNYSLTKYSKNNALNVNNTLSNTLNNFSNSTNNNSTNNANNNSTNKNKNLSDNGVVEIDSYSLSDDEKEYLSILSLIQKKTFNKTHGDNEYTFKKDNYMVNYLNKTCVAASNTLAVINGNESEKECLEKGGSIGNTIPTTYTTIQYYKSGESNIDEIDEEELYYTKEGKSKKEPLFEPEGYLKNELLLNKSLNSNAVENDNTKNDNENNKKIENKTKGKKEKENNDNQEEHPNLLSDDSPEVIKSASLAKENFKNIKKKIMKQKLLHQHAREAFTNYDRYQDPDKEESIPEEPFKVCARMHPALLITIVFVILFLIVYFYILT